MRTTGLRVAALVVVIASALAGPVAAAHAERPLLGTNHIVPDELITNTGTTGQVHCQGSERAPRGTRAIRLSLQPFEAPSGPAIHVELRRVPDERPIVRGARGPGWTGETVTVPLHAAVRRTQDVTVCLTVEPGAAVSFLGRTHRTSESPPEGVRVDYLGAERASPRSGGPERLLLALLALVAALVP